MAVGASETFRRPSLVGVGTVVWLASELMFFAGLFAAYYTLRASNVSWPPPGTDLSVARTGGATLVLIASSYTMHRAVRDAEMEDRDGMTRWIAATIALALIFLANLGLEWSEFAFSISSNAYSSVFYLMTGFHGLHVVGGVLFMIGVLIMTLGRSSRAPAAETMQVCGYYWHFVDAVWVVMYGTIYLLK
jgi:cytochrome c oxidase subunit 3